MNTTINTSTGVEPYWEIVRNLSDDKKQQLIILLDRSLKHKPKEPQTLDQLYGIWSDERVDVDEF